MKAAASKNIGFVAHSDLGGRSDGVQVMVQRGYAYIGHGVSNVISTLDVLVLRTVGQSPESEAAPTTPH